MEVLFSNLHKYAPALGEQLASGGEAVAEVGQVGMDAELPGVAEGFDLLGLAGEVFGFGVLDVAFLGRDLPVGAELDAVGRVEVDHLHAPLRRSFSARLVMTSGLSPRMRRLVQYLSCR